MRSSDAVVEVWLGGVRVCRTDAALQVLETSHPPTWYLPRADVVEGSLREAAGTSFCEFKGMASYLDVVGGAEVAERAAWTYPDPTPGYASLLDHVALYVAPMERVTVDGEVVRPQPGGFYGGWMTSSVAGPVKGGPGSAWW